MYVYVLYDYGEHGAENTQATLNRADVPKLFERYAEKFPSGDPKYDEALTNSLNKVLAKTDEELFNGMYLTNGEWFETDTNGRQDLGTGWGGPVLQVIRLAE